MAEAENYIQIKNKDLIERNRVLEDENRNLKSEFSNLERRLKEEYKLKLFGAIESMKQQ